MSMNKIANYYYNLGRQKAAQDMLGNIRTKTAAPRISSKQLAALLGGGAAVGAGGLGVRKYLAEAAALAESNAAINAKTRAEVAAAAKAKADAIAAAKAKADAIAAAKLNAEVGQQYGMAFDAPFPASGLGIQSGEFTQLFNRAAQTEGLGTMSGGGGPLTDALTGRLMAEEAMLANKELTTGVTDSALNLYNTRAITNAFESGLRPAIFGDIPLAPLKPLIPYIP